MTLPLVKDSSHGCRMDADTQSERQGLAPALVLLGIYNVADLVEMARCGVLHEVWS